MKSGILRWWPQALSLLFAALAAAAWSVRFVGSLSYQEQYQLFLWTPEYFFRSVSLPGGFADWTAEFLTQFNFIPVLGAVIIALLFLLFQRLTWLAMKALGTSRGWYPLSFVPVMSLWLFQSDPNVMQSLTVALAAAVAAVYALAAYGRKAKRNLRIGIITAVLAVPAFYWLFGTAVYIPVLAALTRAAGTKRLPYITSAIFAAVYALALVYAASYFLPYTTGRLLTGLHYYRYPVGVPAMLWVVMAVTAVLPYLSSLLPRTDSAVLGTVLFAALAAGGGTLIAKSFDDTAHELIDYDYLVRTEKWDAIIKKAEKRPATSPMGVSVVNLALSQKGLLLERLFDFYQNGGEGLFPAFARDILSPVSTAEVFFRLGMVNDCERYCFEAMQSIPDYRKSGRLMKRITQCEIANGQYRVARRYLLQLSRTAFYRKWALSALRTIENEKLVAANPTYARLRANREKRSDYLFSENEMDQMVGLLLMNNRSNRMAYEYLIAYELLQRDLRHFSEYYVLGRDIEYRRIPTVVQQVLVGQWLQTHPTLRDMPYSVEPAVANATVDFIRTYMADRTDARLSRPPMSSNAWRYLLE